MTFLTPQQLPKMDIWAFEVLGFQSGVEMSLFFTFVQVSQEAIATSAEEVLQRLINIDDFNLSSMSQFAINNMGTLSSVLEQVLNSVFMMKQPLHFL